MLTCSKILLGCAIEHDGVFDEWERNSESMRPKLWNIAYILDHGSQTECLEDRMIKTTISTGCVAFWLASLRASHATL